MPILPRSALIVMLVVSCLCALLYGSLGTAKAMAVWNWMDIVGEGGTAVMSAIWALLILGSRPRGRVTSLLAGGLAAIMLGAWVDCLDEFFSIPQQQLWDNWLESLLTPGGMLALTAGLYHWRQEQWSLNEHMQKRERLFREHRSFDRITQLANADYLHRQLRMEQARQPDATCALILLDLDQFHRINREHGQREGDRLLQAVSHLLLLNMRPQDLICRYAGDRFAILLPATTAGQAAQIALHLQRALAGLAHHTRTGEHCLRITARSVWGVPGDDLEAFLAGLNARLEDDSPAMAAGLASA
ncbi:GGDEF domain-containing protein [Uliginosibacterium flavum]|uniref:diguanylate cyclase n=1 Tax=Uliginosibacterium flavum TaxID=1396831 RepID=A0ABV2TLR3_9RHOO